MKLGSAFFFLKNHHWPFFPMQNEIQVLQPWALCSYYNCYNFVAVMLWLLLSCLSTPCA